MMHAEKVDGHWVAHPVSTLRVTPYRRTMALVTSRRGGLHLFFADKGANYVNLSDAPKSVSSLADISGGNLNLLRSPRPMATTFI
ncbi:MAG: hypothetical protein M5R36_12290 [Deltaproteobacteria bacterium]|nr:hypothetical protein [Deltaproteobacteria bacterium]